MKLIVANLKMNMDFKTTLEYVNNVDKSIVVCPSYIYIPYFLKNSIVGAQDCFIYDTGSYTGYISPLHLKEMGVQYVIIGHSERRKVEDDLLINKKIIAAINNGLKVILCIGENLEEDKNTKLLKQISLDLENIPVDNVIIAYEPIWAIGTGVIPTNEQIKETVTLIKTTIKEKFNKDIKVLYGGSVDIKNIDVLNQIDNVDGFLVGKASIDYEQINKMNKIVQGE